MDSNNQSEKFVTDSSEVPTKEWLKAERRAEYEKGKAERHAAKKAEKIAKAEDRAAARRSRDEALRSAIKPASSLDKEAVD